MAPSSAAIAARAAVRNVGEKSCTAMRVAGKEPLKMMTPMSPLPHPALARVATGPVMSFLFVPHGRNG